MLTVVLVLHVFIVIALVTVVLLQRSEGGALGIGGGGAGGFMTSRGAANALTRSTTILAAMFFATSLGLAIFADRGEDASDLTRELTGDDLLLDATPNGGEITSEDLLQGFETTDEAETPEEVDPAPPAAEPAPEETPASDPPAETSGEPQQ